MAFIVGQAVREIISGAKVHIAHLSAAETIIFDIAIILIVSACLALIARFLRQPLIPAYVVAGLLIGPVAFGFIQSSNLISAFSEIGIAFLLFIAGLEISFKKIREANLKKILVVGILQIVLIFIIGFFLVSYVGLSPIQASYIGIILAFSSTMVDVKLLADNGEIVTLHGRLVLGILLLQDLAAIIAIILFTTGSFNPFIISLALVKLAILIVFATLFQIFVLNRVFRFAARSTELLFLASLAVLFTFVILSYLSELSIVIGAFVAGVSLANTPFKTELESRISPLRDFFAILFFVALGMQFTSNGVGEYLGLLAIIIVGALIIKPFVTFILMRIVGYQPRTSFHTSTILAQLSEFSLILGILGNSLGVLNQSLFSTIILATVVTMSATPYFVNYKEKFYKILSYPVSFFEFLPIHEKHKHDGESKKEVILIGAHRMGSFIIERLLGEKEKLLVVDYNPEIISHLARKNISCIYGDISSPDLLSKINLKGVRTVVSTVPGFQENLNIIKHMKSKNKRIKVIVTGNRISETLKLYEKGADYVITPKILAGEEISNILRSRKKDIKEYRKEHLKRINKIHKLLY